MCELLEIHIVALKCVLLSLSLHCSCTHMLDFPSGYEAASGLSKKSV